EVVDGVEHERPRDVPLHLPDQVREVVRLVVHRDDQAQPVGGGGHLRSPPTGSARRSTGSPRRESRPARWWPRTRAPPAAWSRPGGGTGRRTGTAGRPRT